MAGTSLDRLPFSEVARLAPGEPTDRLAGAWLLSLRSTNTREAYRRDLSAFRSWLAEVAGIDLLDAHRAHIDAYAEHVTRTRGRNGNPARPTTVARALAAVSSFYAYACSVRATDANPVAAVRRPKTGEAYVELTPALDADETRALLAAASAPRDRVLVLLLLDMGLRASEAVALDLDNVEAVQGKPSILVHGKGGTESRMTLSVRLAEALATLTEHEGRTRGPILLGKAGERMTRHGVAAALDRLGRAADLDRSPRPHVLRATAITLALAHMPLHDVQDFARHSDPRTTRRYDRARGALDKIRAVQDAISAATEAVAS